MLIIFISFVERCRGQTEEERLHVPHDKQEARGAHAIPGDEWLVGGGELVDKARNIHGFRPISWF